MEEQDAAAGGLGPEEAHNLPFEPGSIPGPATNPEPEPTTGRWARAMRTNRGANGGTTRLPPGQQWAHHEGFNARLRRHRQAWAQYEKQALRDGYAKVTRERLLDYVGELNLSDTAAELCAMGLCLRAKVAAADGGMSWTTALNRILNELEEQAAAAEAKRMDPSVGVRLSEVSA